MDQFAVLATLFGLPAVVALLLVRRNDRRRREARLGPDGVQEMEIVVLGGYTPDVAIAREGIPLRLRFTRLENEECSSRVIFSELGVDRRLPAYRTTCIELPQPPRGEYLFTSEMGIYRGRLIVESSTHRYWLPW
ncbi:MAG: cupredoxin domain-containing protein [Sphingomonadaceae bacterium]